MNNISEQEKDTLVLRAEGLVKRYGKRTVVNDVAFDVKQGEIVGLLGPNGAGKTTTIKMLTCLAKPSGGDALVGGYSITKQAEQVKQLIGVSPQETAVAPNLTVKENLYFMAGVYQIENKDEKLAPASMTKMMSLIIIMEEIEKGNLKLNQIITVSENDTLEINITSIVSAFFYDQIYQVITSTLQELNIDKIKVEAVDKGALDYTIKARLITAIERMG